MIRRKKRVWQWVRGAGVTVDSVPEWKGIITEPGDEVSQVKLTDGTRMYIPNVHLIPEEE